jgi:hypothetical protein
MNERLVDDAQMVLLDRPNGKLGRKLASAIHLERFTYDLSCIYTCTDDF